MRMNEGTTAFKVLAGNPTGKRPLVRRDDNIRMDLKEKGINTKELG